MPGHDLMIDPVTRDLIDADDGEFKESESSAPYLVMMFLVQLASWWGDSLLGTRVPEASTRGTSDDELLMLQDAALSGLKYLEKNGLIRQPRVAVKTDGPNRAVLETWCIDANNGQRVEVSKFVKVR